jgi:hypothetical protein
MKSIIIKTDDTKEIKLFKQPAKRPGKKSKVLSKEEMLDLGLLKAMKKGRKSDYVSEDEINAALKR